MGNRLVSVLALLTFLTLAAAALPGAAAAAPFQFGIAGNRDQNVAQARSLGTRLVRFTVPASTRAKDLDAPVAAYARRGIKLLLLADYSYDRFATLAEARQVGNWARRFGTRIAGIEWGNETFSRHARGPGAGAEYGRTVAVALDAVQAGDPRVPLLVQADDGNTGLADAVRDMFAAAPELRDPNANIGWTIHPYGTRSLERLDRLVAQVTRFGGEVSARKPLWITEWGLATDNGRTLFAGGRPHNYGWNPAMSYDEAAQVLRATVDAMLARYGAWIRALFYFQLADQAAPGISSEREGYFGALRKDGNDKGALTAEVRRLVVTYPG